MAILFVHPLMVGNYVYVWSIVGSLTQTKKKYLSKVIFISLGFLPCVLVSFQTVLCFGLEEAPTFE